MAEKYGTNKDVIARRAKAENWERDRETARDKAATKSIQRAANAAADNAVLAQEIRRELLQRLKRTIDRYPIDATEVRQQKDGKTLVYKLVDIAKVYRDLTDTPNADADAEPVKVIFDV